jgi:hypothetical protein
MDLKPLHQRAANQHGLITRFQAAELGISKSQWHRLNNRGLLLPIYPNVSAIFGFPPTRHQSILAAVLSGDGLGIASHRTAAALWGIWTPKEGEPIDIIKLGRKRMAPVVGVHFHHPRDHEDIAPIKREKIRTTSAARTLLDFAAVEPYKLPLATEKMLINADISRDRLIAAVARHSERGRSGIGPMRDLLATWPYASKPADSVLELEMKLKSQSVRFAPILVGLNGWWRAKPTAGASTNDAKTLNDSPSAISISRNKGGSLPTSPGVISKAAHDT